MGDRVLLLARTKSPKHVSVEMFRYYSSLFHGLRLKRKIEVPFPEGEILLAIQIKQRYPLSNDSNSNGSHCIRLLQNIRYMVMREALSTVLG